MLEELRYKMKNRKALQENFDDFRFILEDMEDPDGLKDTNKSSDDGMKAMGAAIENEEFNFEDVEESFGFLFEDMDSADPDLETQFQEEDEFEDDSILDDPCDMEPETLLDQEEDYEDDYVHDYAYDMEPDTLLDQEEEYVDEYEDLEDVETLGDEQDLGSGFSEDFDFWNEDEYMMGELGIDDLQAGTDTSAFAMTDDAESMTDESLDDKIEDTISENYWFEDDDMDIDDDPDYDDMDIDPKQSNSFGFWNEDDVNINVDMSDNDSDDEDDDDDDSDEDDDDESDIPEEIDSEEIADGEEELSNEKALEEAYRILMSEDGDTEINGDEFDKNETGVLSGLEVGEDEEVEEESFDFDF